MNAAQKRYFAINQLLCGRKFSLLPDDVKDLISDYEDDWESLQRIKVEKLTGIEEAFLRLLRVPFYNISSTKDKKVVVFEQIVSLIRRGEASVSECAAWAAAAIVDVEYTDIGPLVVKDGVLYLPNTKEYYGIDLNSAMKKAFELRCWGSVHPTADVKNLVAKVIEISSPREDITVSDKLFAAVMQLFKSANMNPEWLARTAVYVNNLSYSVSGLQGICWWKNFDRDQVIAMLPRGKGDTLATAVIPRSEFLKIVSSSSSALENMRVQGTRIVFGE